MKNKNGFTLIELLAVIILIALIMVVTSTSVMGILKEQRANLKEKQFNELKEAAESYINDVLNQSDSEAYLIPQTAGGDGDKYSGYGLLEYVSNCVPSENHYCIKEEVHEEDKKNSTVGHTAYVDVKYTTRTIFFDITAIHDYINLDNFNITYDKELYDMDYKNKCSDTALSGLDYSDPQKVKCLKRSNMITNNNNVCGLKVVIKVKMVYDSSGYTNGYYKLVDSYVVERTQTNATKCVK